MTKLELVKTYICGRGIGKIVSRQALLLVVEGKTQCVSTTTDNYRNWFTRASYLERVKAGVYRVVKLPSKKLTKAQLLKEAYPEREKKDRRFPRITNLRDLVKEENGFIPGD